MLGLKMLKSNNNQDSRIQEISERKTIDLNEDKLLINFISQKKKISLIDVRCLIKLFKAVFVDACYFNKFEKKKITALTTKFRDAGRRSAPWQPASKKVPGRPQDGKDGNRINRWLMDKNHKFYATELDATLVEIKYYLQAFSMKNAPTIDHLNISIKKIFTPWLIEHEVKPGLYKDPLSRQDIDFKKFINDPSEIQSGHLNPLDCEGKHELRNTFLMLKRSNIIQGNLKINELVNLLEKIVEEHKKNPFLI